MVADKPEQTPTTSSTSQMAQGQTIDGVDIVSPSCLTDSGQLCVTWLSIGLAQRMDLVTVDDGFHSYG